MVAAAVMVEGACDQFLAGAAIAKDQDVDVLPGNATDLFEHRSHRRSPANNQVGIVHVVFGSLDKRRSSHQPSNFTRTADDIDELLIVKWFDEIVELRPASWLRSPSPTCHAP